MLRAYGEDVSTLLGLLSFGRIRVSSGEPGAESAYATEVGTGPIGKVHCVFRSFSSFNEGGKRNWHIDG